MTTEVIGEVFQLGSPYTTGWWHTHLREEVTARYRQDGTPQPNYELIIDAKRGPKVKRARNDGLLLTFWERLRYGLRARLALISNRPVITSMVASLISLNDAQLDRAESWQLLTYDLEWKVESSEQFYGFFLRERAAISESEILAAISGAIRAQVISYLRRDGGAHTGHSSTEPVVQTMLDQIMLGQEIIAKINQQIGHTGIRVRRFYPPQVNDDSAIIQSLIPNILATMSDFRRDLSMGKKEMAVSTLRGAIINGLLAHLCQELNFSQGWLISMLRICGFAFSLPELRAALSTGTLPSANNHEASSTPPLLVVQKLKQAGCAKLRLSNRTAWQEVQLRSQLRQQAQIYLELALLLSDAPLLNAREPTAVQSIHFELAAMTEALRDVDQKRIAQISFGPGSTIHLMAVAMETLTPPGGPERESNETMQFVQEILPVTVQPGDGEPVTVWTPRAAEERVKFVGAEEEISLMLQVIDPNRDAVAETMPEFDSPNRSSDPPLFWRWKVRARHEHFSVRLRSTAVPTHYEVEVHDAEFLHAQPERSTTFPSLPRIRHNYEPLELALLIDGYWLAGDANVPGNLRSGLTLLADLLDELDALENESKRGLLLHAVICLDDHISPHFLAQYGAIPCVYALDHAPIETTAQLLAEWLEPWVEHWHTWAIKPYPVDTDISLEKGLHYLNHLKWQRTKRREQRAVLAFGRSRPHDHVWYFPDPTHVTAAHTANITAPPAIPYHPDDRFSVTGIDWREELRGLREKCATILALCDPGLPNPRYHLPTNHPLFREYQEFWAMVDPQTLLDISDREMRHCAEMGISRVLQTLDTQFFQRRIVHFCEPPLDLPLSQIVPAFR